MIVELILNKPDDEGNIAFSSNDVKSITMKGVKELDSPLSTINSIRDKEDK